MVRPVFWGGGFGAHPGEEVWVLKAKSSSSFSRQAEQENGGLQNQEEPGKSGVKLIKTVQ